MNSDINFKIDKLAVRISRARSDLGAAAGFAVAEKIRELLAKQKRATMVFAAAPSQDEFFQVLCRAWGVDWSRITAFHMDEYIGLPDGAPQKFGTYLKEHLFDRIRPGRVFYLNGTDSTVNECERYANLLKEQPIDIVCCGIGENGHLAFNDPGVADFNDPLWVKKVQLDEQCRMQQVHDGCFSSITQVPTHALTLTIPSLLSGRWLYCMVPGSTKREAVRRTLEGEISTECPASILRTHDHSFLFLDSDSANLLDLSAYKQ